MSQDIDIIRGSNIKKDDLIDIVELNKIVYGADFTAPLELTESIHNKNPDICLAAKDNSLNKVIGYISAIPLSPEAFNKATDPYFDEAFIADDVVKYNYCNMTTKRYHLYVASIVVEPAYQKHGISRRLYYSFLGFLLELGKENNILFDDIAARATPKGEKLCKSIGMSHIGTSNKGEKIFYIRMLPPSLKESSDKGIELVQFYEDRYQENKR